MTLTLEAAKTVGGVAANATSVTYTILGDEVGASDSFKVLAQGQLPAAAGTLYTTPGATATIVKTILLINTAGTAQAVTMYLGGTAAANSIGSFNIPVGGSATWNGVWNLRDANGASLTTSTVTLTGDVTGTGTGSVPTTLATVATPGTTGDASHVAQVTLDAKGRTTTATSVAIAIPESAVTNLVTDLAGKQPTGNYLTALTGDVAASGPGSAAATLATVNGAPGTKGSASAVPVFVVNGKGLVTSETDTAIQITESQVTNLTTDLAGKQPTGNYVTALTGDVTAAGPGSVAATLATVNANVGAFGSATAVAAFTVNGKGLTTAASAVPIQIAESQVTNLVTDLAGKAVSSRLINTTSPITGGGDLTADRTIAMPAAIPTAPGYMTAAFANTVNDLWYDVTNYGVSISNTGAANVAAMNTLIQTTAPASARFFFPATGANYPMAGTITVTKNYQRFIGAGQINSVLFVGNTTQDLFVIQDSVAGVEFHDLGFWTTAAATAGSVFNVGTVSGVGCQQTSFYNLGFNPFGGNFFNCIVFNGSRGGEVSFVDGCVLNAFTNWGVAVVGNTSTPTSTAELVISNTIMNGQITGSTGAVAGIYVQQCGAVNVTDCSIILCNNNLLVSPLVSVSQIVASVLIENTFFDSAFGDSAKFGGVGAIVRCKFSNCYFTLAAAAPNGSASFSFLNTAGNAPAGIDFVNCSFLNTFGNANTTFGVLMTNVADVQHVNSKVSGWTTGISVTPQVPAGSTRVQIIGGVVGPAGGIKGNGTGILLNAGATTYGLVQILGVSMPLATAFGAANTTQLTDSSTIIAGGTKVIALNTGLIVSTRPTNVTATAIPLTTITSLDSLGGLPFPANSRPGTRVRITAHITSAATAQTLTLRVLFGPNNTNADAQVASVALGAGTALVGSATVTVDFVLVSTTTALASIMVVNAGTTGVTNAAVQVQASAGLITVATAAAQFLGLYGSSATAAALTVRAIAYEVISQ